MNFGIDAIGFYIPRYYLDLETFAVERGESIERFYGELGQERMAIAPPNEDVVTMAANAVAEILSPAEISTVEMVIFATETGVDLSKAAATYIHRMFQLPSRCRAIEFKQACYGATCGLQLGISWLHQHPDRKVLLIASDIAHYQSGSAAESSQGAGAVALLLSANPRLLAIEPECGFCTQETMDFWRPCYLPHALVDGKLSCEAYIRLAEKTWQQYAQLSGRKFTEHARFCYHVPVAKLVERTHLRLAKINGLRLSHGELLQQIGESLRYSRLVGNCYTASLYLGILSLLESSVEDLSGKLIGLYSYGSGSVAEFFAARVMPGYQVHLSQQLHRQLLEKRQKLSFAEYRDINSFHFPEGGGMIQISGEWQTGRWRLKGLQNHQRIYEQVE